MEKTKFRINKQVTFILLSALFFLILFEEVDALKFYDIAYKCKNDKCVQGQDAEWIVTIDNVGETKIEIISVSLYDAFSNKQFALFNTTYRPLSDERGDLWVINSREKSTQNAVGFIPKANNGTNLFYYLCFTLATREQLYVTNNIYQLEHCYTTLIEVMPALECFSNNSCELNEYCRGGMCNRLSCGECGYPWAHECVKYGCCSSETCGNSQACMKNKCVDLNCNDEEILFNHTCIFLNCSKNEAMLNHACINLTCRNDEEIFNHSCRSLGCTETQAIVNHTCTNLNCADTQFLFNHACNNLNCEYDKTPTGHYCRQLRCNIFQKVIDHKCETIQVIVIKLISELISLSIIIFVLIVDIKKYKKMKSENDLKSKS